MAAVGDIVFARVRNQAGDTLPVCGWLLEEVEVGEELIVGCLATAAKGVAETSTTKVGQQQVGYLRIARTSASGTAPTQWTGERAKDLPSFSTILKGWKDLNRELKSSEAECWEDPVQDRPAAERRTRGAKKLAADFAQLGSLFGGELGRERRRRRRGAHGAEEPPKPSGELNGHVGPRSGWRQSPTQQGSRQEAGGQLSCAGRRRLRHDAAVHDELPHGGQAGSAASASPARPRRRLPWWLLVRRFGRRRFGARSDRGRSIRSSNGRLRRSWE